jgi:Domain of unknown function (DUF4345)
MVRTYSTIVLAVAGLFSLAIAARGLLAPALLGSSLGYGLPGADALNEVRAQYGGYFLAVAIACALAVFRVVPRPAALLLLTVTFGGVLFGRLVSLFLDGGFGVYGPTIQLLYVVDAVGLVAAAIALAGERRAART